MAEPSSWLKPALGGFGIGTVGAWIVLALLGWVSPDEAARMAAQSAENAVVAYATPVCVTRFERHTNASTEWKDLRDAIAKERLVTEPRQKIDRGTADAIADSCATQLMTLHTLKDAKIGLR